MSCVESKETPRVKIKEARTQLGMSIETAAKAVGISASMWTKIERGERTPSLRVARKIADMLQCRIDDLFYT